MIETRPLGKSSVECERQRVIETRPVSVCLMKPSGSAVAASRQGL